MGQTATPPTQTTNSMCTRLGTHLGIPVDLSLCRPRRCLVGLSISLKPIGRSNQKSMSNMAMAKTAPSNWPLLTGPVHLTYSKARNSGLGQPSGEYTSQQANRATTGARIMAGKAQPSIGLREGWLTSCVNLPILSASSHQKGQSNQWVPNVEATLWRS